MSAQEETAGQDVSPFDQIARTDDDGNVYWSARDLMPLMGYFGTSAWTNFHVGLKRARQSAQNAGMTCLFFEIEEKATGGRPRADYHLDRMAAYLVAMNGDPNKPEVSAAQAYFAVKTRQAETFTAPPAIPQTYVEALRELATTVEQRESIV
ncbi:hypothetical protein QP992_03630 [Corynebacterium ulcerans]|uniref:hypothetical protein n=1 Tax=Corynebacterium ulcerans TaxID=65058 RepID=UPI0018D5FC85|nr:hypothetical protein [Corynebacterium ulcerans]MBH5296525.1 hypothetical protein [Corynebacterium ulcerans]MDK8888230.1 hypothetical protein [Corynebacterium ulcerans]